MTELEQLYGRARRLQIILSALIAASILSISVMVGVAVFVVREEGQAADAIATQVAEQEKTIARLERTEKGICAFRRGLREDFNRTEAYIRDVRNGDREPIPGLEISDLRASQQSRLKRIEELAVIHCMPKRQGG